MMSVGLHSRLGLTVSVFTVMVEFITEGMSDATTLTLTYIVRVFSFKMAFQKSFSMSIFVAHGRAQVINIVRK